LETIRETLNTIKKIRGFHTDAELSADMAISLHTIRSWIRNESITRQLIRYCEKYNISLDEVLLGQRCFNKERCELCAMRLKCDEYRRATAKSLVVNEGAFSPKVIVLNTSISDSIRWNMYYHDMLKGQLAFDLDQINRIVIELHPSCLE